MESGAPFFTPGQTVPAELIQSEDAGGPAAVGQVIDPADIVSQEPARHPLLSRTPKDLADDDTFDPVGYAKTYFDDLGNDRELLTHLAEVDRLRGLKPMNPVKVAVGAAKGFGQMIADAPRMAQNVAGTALKATPGVAEAVTLAATGELDTDVASAMRTEAKTEFAASVESQSQQTASGLVGAVDRFVVQPAARGIALSAAVADAVAEKAGVGPGQLRSFVRAVGQAAKANDPALMSTDQNADSFLQKVALTQTIDESSRGEGPVLQAAGFDMAALAQEGIVVDPQVVEDLGLLTDVTEYIPALKGFKAVARGKTLLSAPTKAAAMRGVQKLRQAGASAARRAADVAGAAGKIQPTTAAIAGAVVDGGAGAAAAATVPRVARLAEKGLQAGAEMIEGSRAIPGADVMGAVAGSAPVRGALRGLAAPFSPELDNVIPMVAAAGQGSDEQIGQAIGSTAAFGAMGGAAGGAAKGGADYVVKKRFEQIQREPVADIEYGTDPALDAAHRAQMAAIRTADPAAANSLNWIRATALPAGSELYVLPNDVFSRQVSTALGQPDGTQFDTPGFIETRPDGSTRVYLNENTTALGHEAGHALVAAMDPNSRRVLFSSIKSAYGPEQIQRFGQVYDALLGAQQGAEGQGMRGDETRIINELAAEMLTSALYSEPLDAAPPGLYRQIIGGLAQLAEATTLYQPQVGASGPLASALGVTPSVQASDFAMNFLRNAQNDPNWMAGPRPPVIPPPAPAPVAPAAGDMSRREFLSGGISARRRNAQAGTPPATPQPAPTAPVAPTAPTAAPQPPATPQPAPARRQVSLEDIESAVEQPVQPPGSVPPVIPPTVPPVIPAAPAQPTPPVIPPAPRTSAERLAQLRQQAAQPPARPQNMRVTPEEQATLDTQRQVTGAVDAERAIAANPGLYDETAQRAFADINAALQRPQGQVAPVRLTYRSVTPTQGGASNARARKAEQDAAYEREAQLALQGLPSDVRTLFDKVTIPYRWTSENGNVNVFAMSFDKVLANLRTVTRRAEAAGARNLVPYATTAQGNLTPDAARQFAADLRTYTANQANGYSGAGAEVTVPQGYRGQIPEQNPSYRPVAIDPNRADFINLLMGISPPATARVTADARQRGSVPNVEAGRLAAANQRPVVQAATANPDRNTYGVNPAVGITTPTPIVEPNPLRNEFARRGVDLTGRNLFQVTENLNLQDIQSVTPAPESGFRAPSKDLIQAGFMPSVEAARAPLQGNEDVRRVGADYTKAAGMTGTGYSRYAAVNVERAKNIADAYEAAQHDPNNPEVVAAYRKLADETRAQWDAIEAAGYRMLPWTQPGQPYASSEEMVADVRDNKRLYFFTTDGGFGTDPSGVPLEHPLLEPTGVQLEGKELVVNDLFRAVHDFFGHAKEGYQFGPRGEYNAYLAHAAMFTPDAVRALATETLAQNSWVNYGRHLRDAQGRVPERGQPGYVPVTERPFADQKAFLLPEATVREATPSLTQVSFMPTAAEYEARRALDRAAAAKTKAQPKVTARDVERPKPGEAQLVGERLPASYDKKPEVRAVRYSSRAGSPTASPQNFGKGVATSTDRRGLPKVYFYEEGSPTGSDKDVVATAGKTKYGARLSTARLYDAMGEDPLNYLGTVNREKADQQLIDAGYAGLRIVSGDGRKIIALFEPVAQTELGRAMRNEGRATVPKNAPSFMPKPVSDEVAKAALSSEKQPKFGAARDTAPGTKVGLRVDIPAFLRTGNYVVSVHEAASGGRVGKIIGYDSKARVTDPTFFVNEAVAERIRDGQSKSPIATVEGAYAADQDIPDVSDWLPVGMNPKKHSYFYDKESDRPVVSGSEAALVGNTVYVKDPVFGEASDFRFMPYAGPQSDLDARQQDAYSAAQAMDAAGRDQEDIRAATGWFRGRYDDKWRYEVRDDRASLKIDSVQRGPTSLTLGEILDHPDLFKAYPEAKRIRAYFSDRLPDGASAVYNPRTKSITLDSTRIPDRLVERVIPLLLHEVQHWIQDREGFARGSDLQEFDSEDLQLSPEDAAKDQALVDEQDRIEDEITSLREAMAKIPESEKGVGTPIADMGRRLDGLWDRLGDLRKQSRDIRRPYVRARAEEAYRNSAGEIEARDVELRRRMSPERRAELPPYASENIPKERAGVYFMPRPESPERKTRADIDRSTLPPGQARDLDSWVSTRTPWAKKRENEGLENDLVVGTEEVFDYTPKAKAKLVKHIQSIPGMNDIRGGFEPTVFEFRDRLVDNLLLLHDAMPGDFRNRARMWYDGARVLAERFADRYGVSTAQAAAVLATLSPQKDWYQNVHLAEMVMEAVTEHQNTRLPAESIAWAREKIKTIPAEAEKAIRKSWSKKKQREKREAAKKSAQLFALAVDAIEGKTLAETPEEYRPQWVRAYWQRLGKQGTPVVTPEGSILRGVTKGSTAWQSYSTVAKAIDAVRAPDRATISALVGEMHKVRNFYNNILVPDALLGDITVDTHAIAAALMLPYGSSVDAVKIGLGSGGGASSITGSQGLYGVYADAYRMAAAQRGMLPRQMQSITWEALRGVYLPKSRTKSSPIRIAIEKDYADVAAAVGDRIAAVMKAIETAGGFKLPEWFTNAKGYLRLDDWNAGRLDAAIVDETEEGSDED